MTALETELLNEIERLQDEILKLQDVIKNKQNENIELQGAYENLRKARTSLYYSDLAEKYKQELENILLTHKNELDNLDKEQSEIGNTKIELNQLLENGKNEYLIAEYHKLENDYKALQNNYILLETELLTIKETLNKSLEDIEKLFQEAYNELTTNMAENLEKVWKSKLQQLLPLVDMKLNES